MLKCATFWPWITMSLSESFSSNFQDTAWVLGKGMVTDKNLQGGQNTVQNYHYAFWGIMVFVDITMLVSHVARLPILSEWLLSVLISSVLIWGLKLVVWTHCVQTMFSPPYCFFLMSAVNTCCVVISLVAILVTLWLQFKLPVHSFKICLMLWLSSTQNSLYFKFAW